MMNELLSYNTHIELIYGSVRPSVVWQRFRLLVMSTGVSSLVRVGEMQGKRSVMNVVRVLSHCVVNVWVFHLCLVQWNNTTYHSLHCINNYHCFRIIDFPNMIYMFVHLLLNTKNYTLSYQWIREDKLLNNSIIIISSHVMYSKNIFFNNIDVMISTSFVDTRIFSMIRSYTYFLIRNVIFISTQKFYFKPYRAP